MGLRLINIFKTFDSDTFLWTLQDKKSGQYITVPDRRRNNSIRFFMSESDAEDVLMKLLEAVPSLKDKEICPVQVRALETLQALADTVFAIHSPDEVYELIKE